MGRGEVEASHKKSQESLKLKDVNGLEYYRVNADLKSILSRIRLERTLMSPPQRHKSSLEKSTDFYGDYKLKNYSTEARALSNQSLSGTKELRLPLIKKNQSALQKKLKNNAGYTLLKSDWERTAQN